MIASVDRASRYDLYYLGSVVIDILTSEDIALSTNESSRYDFMEVFYKVKETDDISINLFMQTLCWLNLLGLVDYQNGEVVKCF